MNKTELVAAVAEKTGVSKKESEQVINAIFETVTETLVKGEKVQVVGFGSFETKTRPAHAGHNPKTMETIEIPASRSVVFKTGKALKDAVAE